MRNFFGTLLGGLEWWFGPIRGSYIMFDSRGQGIYLLAYVIKAISTQVDLWYPDCAGSSGSLFLRSRSLAFMADNKEDTVYISYSGPDICAFQGVIRSAALEDAY
jgi:hypothetical protein